MFTHTNNRTYTLYSYTTHKSQTYLHTHTYDMHTHTHAHTLHVHTHAHTQVCMVVHE